MRGVLRVGLVLLLAAAEASADWRKQVLQQSSAFEVNLTADVRKPAAHKRHGKQYLVPEGGGDSSEANIKAGYGSGAQPVSASASSPAASAPAVPAPDAPVSVGAPVKTAIAGISKEKFNYASFDCGAIILATNPGAKHATSILIENKDHYMLNHCSAPEKFLVVELCEDILVENVLLANLEFFSSTFHKFQISVSDRYPPKLEVGWRMLGEFHARNLRDIQTFRIPNPVIWARYLRIDFLTFYGSEYYCPISLLKVNGKRMMEEFQEEEDKQQNQKPPELLTAADLNITLPAMDSVYHPNASTSNWDAFFADMVSERADPPKSPAAGSVPVAGVPPPLVDDAPVENATDAGVIDPVASENVTAPLGVPGSPEDPIAPVSAPSGIASQESVFKTISKRLAALELNTTLALMYMEMQARRLTDSVVDLDKLQKERIRESHRKMENWSRSRWNTLKTQHDNIITNLVQEIDQFERQIQRSVANLESRLDSASSEIIFYNRVYISLLVVIVATFYLYTQTSRIRMALDSMLVKSRQSEIAPVPSRGQSQDDIRFFEKYDEIEDDADVVTMSREVLDKRSNELSSPLHSPGRSARPSVTIPGRSPLQKAQSSGFSMQVHSLNLERMPVLQRQSSQPLQSAASAGGPNRKKSKKKRRKTQEALYGADGMRRAVPGQPFGGPGDLRPLSAPPSQADLLRNS